MLDWNKPSIDYYKRQGATDISESEGWLAFRMNHAAMKAFVLKGETMGAKGLKENLKA